MLEDSVPTAGVAVVSCHLERPLDDDAWRRFERLQRRRPGGFRIAALMRPPHASEDPGRWLERARIAALQGPLGHHTHWTSPTHARPSGGDPATRVLEESAWLREQELRPTLFCGGGWYMDERVAAAVASLGYTDCTARGRCGSCLVRLAGGARLREAPTTHSLGALARAVAGPLPDYVHAYFHDYDLLDRRRRLALVAALHVLGRRRRPRALDALELPRQEVAFTDAFGG